MWTDDLLQPDRPRTMVLPGVAAGTRVCAYERPGTAALLDDALRPSRSDPVPIPRTAPAVVADLHALLRAAGVPGPYVLVGHSLGGLFVRLYAATYPEEVAGLVLVDAWSETLEQRLTPTQWAAYVRLERRSRRRSSRRYPDLETLDFAAASAALRQAGGRPPPAGAARWSSSPTGSRSGSPRPPWASPPPPWSGRGAGHRATWPPSCRTPTTCSPPRAATTSSCSSPTS